MGSGSSRLLQAFCQQLEFLRCSGFVEAFSVILTFLLCWVCQAEVTQHALVELPALSLHKAPPGTRLGCSSVCQTCSFFPLSFYPKQMFNWAFGDVHSTACTLGKNSLPPRWVIIAELYKGIGVFVPSSHSSFGDKVTSLPPSSN